MNAEEKTELEKETTTTTMADNNKVIEPVPSTEATQNNLKIEKSKSAEEVASMISQQQQISFAKSNENLIVSNFVSYFEPLIHNLDTNVQALRFDFFLYIIVLLSFFKSFFFLSFNFRLRCRRFGID